MLSSMHISLLVVCSLYLQISVVKGLKEGECEVCVGVLNKLLDKLEPEEKSSQTAIEFRFKELCETLKKSENRFCYYIGGLEESATSIVSEMSKPLSWGMPPLKVCEKLIKKDNQICDLKYEKVIDLNTVDLKKLKVRDLKKILSDYDEVCAGCVEKTDYIKKVEDIKRVHFKGDL